MSFDEGVAQSAQALHQAWGARRADVAVVLGSGWGAVAQALQDPIDVRYADLPAFPRMDIAGHAGRVRLGRLPASGGQTGREVMVLMGRQHAYEHGDAAAMRGAIQTVAAAGCGIVVLTNAAGSLHPSMKTGDLMLLGDHLNIAQRSPLVATRGSRRFVDMTQVYDPVLRSAALQAVQAVPSPNANGAAGTAGTASTPETTLHEGVYAWVLGPQFETPAEIRMLRTLGADAVGMSTVPEAIAARHAGLRVMGLSMITNLAAGLSPVALSHEQTLSAADDHETRVTKMLLSMLAAL